MSVDATTARRRFRSSRREWILGSGFGAVWLLLWSAFTLMFDGMIVYFSATTLLAQAYPDVPGEITHSEVRREFDNERDSFHPEVRYRYQVDGRDFTGERVHFYGFGDGNARSAKEVIAKLPVGQRVAVFYNPRDPGNAALQRMLDGRLLFLPLLLLPFNLIMVAGWIWVARRLAGVSSLPLRRESDRWLVLPTNGQPLIVALIASGVLSIVAMFVVGFGGWSEDLSVMITVWATVIVLSIMAFRHTRSLVLREPPVLVLDDALETVTWPSSTNTPELSLPRSRLLGVEIDDLPQIENDQQAWDFSILLSFNDDNGQPAKRLVLKTTSGTEAAALADWLDDWVGRSAKQDSDRLEQDG